MRITKAFSLALAIGTTALATAAQQPTTMTQLVDRIVAQEHAEVRLLHRYSPLVETYIQKTRPDKNLGEVPDGDKYFLGRAELAKGVELEPVIGNRRIKEKLFSGLEGFLPDGIEFLPSGFLQMIYIDMNAFDRQHYKFDYVGREFLGEVRCLVFDVDPLPNTGRGRFVGRIWVEDQDYRIVRFNGAYSGSSKSSYYFNFDSWRTNAGENLWLPAFIYSEEGNVQQVGVKGAGLKAFKAQTRLWGYALGRPWKEEELGTILVEAQTPVKDQTESTNDYSPLQAERSWNRGAEDNFAGKMERLGLMAPYGDVDKTLETVVNNLEVTNDLDIQPEVKCRILMTSTLESFTMGHTIVLSRGLIDVLPDESTLAAILAHELGHILLGQRIDTRFAFFNHLRFNEKEAYSHFGFSHTAAEEQAANQKGIELLQKSPYKDHLGSAQLFLQALRDRSKEVPSLISPHLGDRVPTNLSGSSTAPPTQDSSAKPAANAFAALPLGGRVKIEPWDDHLEMLKSKPVTSVAEYEKMPFEITPFVLYLTRQADKLPAKTSGPIAAKSDTDAVEPDLNPK